MYGFLVFAVAAAASDLLVTIVGAAIGTAVGALVAFALERRKRKQELEDREVAAGNLALFALSRAWNDIENFRREVIEKHRDAPARWFQMQPSVLARVPVSLDISSLAFLFDGPDPNLPAEVLLEIERYASIRHLVDERGALHIGTAQPAVERALVSTGLPATKSVLEEAVGPRVRDTLIGFTDAIVDQVDRVMPSIMGTMEKLRGELKRRYPKRRIIRHEAIPRDETNASQHKGSQ